MSSKDDARSHTILRRALERIDVRIAALVRARDRVAAHLEKIAPSNESKDNERDN